MHYWSQKIKKNEIGGVCSTNGESTDEKYSGYKILIGGEYFGNRGFSKITI
jgi:hypothetical protein